MDAMDHIDPALIAAADAAAPRRGGKRWVRYGLIAACLCLALAGTAFAAVEQYFGVRIVDGVRTDMDVWLEGGINYYPLDSLSEEVQTLDDPDHAIRVFSSWDEMEGFIGVNLMDNPVLDASPAEHYYQKWTVGSSRAEGRFLAIGSAGLSHIRVIGCYEIGKVNISIMGFLFTDCTTESMEDWDQRFLGYSYPDGTELSWETYTTANGLEAQVIKVDHTGDLQKTCLAAFSLNGVPFVVQAASGSSLKGDQEALLQVLDGFVLD